MSTLLSDPDIATTVFGQEADFRYYKIIYRVRASATRWWARHIRPSSLALLRGLIHFRSPR
jgi:hypothetical protein